MRCADCALPGFRAVWPRVRCPPRLLIDLSIRPGSKPAGVVSRWLHTVRTWTAIPPGWEGASVTCSAPVGPSSWTILACWWAAGAGREPRRESSPACGALISMLCANRASRRTPPDNRCHVTPPGCAYPKSGCYNRMKNRAHKP